MGTLYEVEIDKGHQARLQKFKKLFSLYPRPDKRSYFATERALELCRQKGIPVSILRSLESKVSGVTVIRSFPAVIMDPPTEDATDEVIALALAGSEEDQVPVVVYLGRNVEVKGIEGAFILDRPGGRRRYAWRLAPSVDEAREVDVHDRFSKFLSEVRDLNTKFVLSLGGGGLKVYAHACLFRFLDALGAKDSIDEIWGTSGGAIAGLWYASDVPVKEMEQSGYDMYNERFSLKLSPSKLMLLRNLVMHNLVPSSWRPSGFSGFIESAKSIHNFIQKVKKERRPKIPFFCIAYNIQDFKSDVLTPEKADPKLYGDLIFTVDPIEAAVASSSVPVLFVPATIHRRDKDVTYIDGAVTERLPLKSIYEKWSIDRKAGIEKREKLFVLAVKLLPHNIIGMPPEKKVGELQMALLYQDAVVDALIKSQRALLDQDPNVRVWELSIPLTHMGSFDIKAIPAFIKSSYEHLIPQLVKIVESLR